MDREYITAGAFFLPMKRGMYSMVRKYAGAGALFLPIKH